MNTHTNVQQIHVPKTLDVDSVEHQLDELWKDSAGELTDEGAVMRARVANLLIYITGESRLDEITSTLSELSMIHPCRALVVVADWVGRDHDIEIYLSSFCKDRRLFCEVVRLVAHGTFARELPSATLPLLVADLPTFLWWRDNLKLDDKVFASFVSASDRLIIDSAEFVEPETNLIAVSQLCARTGSDPFGITDINWARLTSWRGLLASFYDVPKYRAAFERVDEVTISYAPPASAAETIAPQAVLLAGWLAERLGWSLESKTVRKRDATLDLEFACERKRVRLQLKRVDRSNVKQGRLAQVDLAADEGQNSFLVSRSADNLHLETQAISDGSILPGRVLPVRNRSTSQLLGREMEILGKDALYCEAIKVAAQMMER